MKPESGLANSFSPTLITITARNVSGAGDIEFMKLSNGSGGSLMVTKPVNEGERVDKASSEARWHGVAMFTCAILGKVV